MVRYSDDDVDGILTAHGVTSQADGYSLMDLERFLSARGWQWSVEPVSGRPAGEKPKKRFRAMVMHFGDGRTIGRPRQQLGLRQTRATGASETAALALGDCPARRGECLVVASPSSGTGRIITYDDITAALERAITRRRRDRSRPQRVSQRATRWVRVAMPPAGRPAYT